MWAAAGSVQPVATWLKCSHAEVGELDVVSGVEEDVFWLQVAMADVEAMAIAQSGDYLPKQADSFLLWEGTLLRDVVEKFSAVDVF